MALAQVEETEALVEETKEENKELAFQNEVRHAQSFWISRIISPTYSSPSSWYDGEMKWKKIEVLWNAGRMTRCMA